MTAPKSLALPKLPQFSHSAAYVFSGFEANSFSLEMLPKNVAATFPSPLDPFARHGVPFYPNTFQLFTFFYGNLLTWEGGVMLKLYGAGIGSSACVCRMKPTGMKWRLLCNAFLFLSRTTR
jgi:hypothetical protein